MAASKTIVTRSGTRVQSTLKRGPTAIAMMNMGGPSTLDEVQSFLTNLFTDPEIIPLGKLQYIIGPWVAKRRTPNIRDQYAQIGGGSPILKWTNVQGEGMCKLLDELLPESAPHKHYVFFRYANPLTEVSLRQMKADGVKRAIAFSQYPQWSCTTSGSSFNHLWRELKRLGMANDFKWSIIDRWNTHPGYIDAVANRVRQGLNQFNPEDRDKVIIMFSAHSVPMKVVRKGDPYTKEIASTTERVMEQLGVKNTHILSWQSKVGYLPWMGPSTSDVIKGLGRQGHRHILAVPIAFTSDHIETLFEIDLEYAEKAHEAGITHFKRSPSLNDEPLLFQAMADLVKDHLDQGKLHTTQIFLHYAMLSSRERLNQRQGKYGTPRHEYLQQLITEYQYTSQILRKEEIVANLANFGYDPINYASFCHLHVMDLFIDILDEAQNPDEDIQRGIQMHTNDPRKPVHRNVPLNTSASMKYSLQEFALGGICNCIPDPILQQDFLSNDAIPLILYYINDQYPQRPLPNAETSLNLMISALTICYFLLDSPAFACLTEESVVSRMHHLCEQHENPQVVNIASAFLSRYGEIIQTAEDTRNIE